MKYSRCFLLIACSTIACSPSKQMQTDLYFGLSKPGVTVSQTEWNGFMENHISRVFASGFTVVPGLGKWLDDSTHLLQSEPSVMIISVHDKSKPLNLRIDSLRENYKRLFNQQAVLRVDKKVRASF